MNINSFIIKKYIFSKSFLISSDLRNVQIDITYYLTFFVSGELTMPESVKRLSTILPYLDSPPTALVLKPQYIYTSAYF